VITKDNVQTEINALIYYQVTDPVRAVYEIANLPDAIEKLTQTTLRNVIGEMDLDQTLGSRDVINSKLRAILDEATNKWGAKRSRRPGSRWPRPRPRRSLASPRRSDRTAIPRST